MNDRQPPRRGWTPEELIGLKRLYGGARRHGELKAFARSINRHPSVVRMKWLTLQRAYPACAAMLDDGAGALSYGERMATLREAGTEKSLCGRGGL